MAGTSVSIGKIVRSDSHVRYTCQIFGPGEIAQPPEPTDYAFGTFVRVPLRAGYSQPDLLPLPTAPDATTRPSRALPSADVLVSGADSEHTWAVGLIYDTILVNPDFGTLGPRLSSDTQVELFSPDYLSERAVLVSILLLGTIWEHPNGSARVRHGVPPVAPDLSAVVGGMSEAEVRAFHLFADYSGPADIQPYLHMGYLPHAIAQVNPLMPVAMLHTIERLERLCPENAALLSIVKRNFAWRLKVETAG
jgi:hypothetical protein